MKLLHTLESRMLLSFGDLDPQFDLDGFARHDAGGIDAITAVHRLADNRILAAGNSDSHGLLAMFTPTGQLDSSFGNGGMVTVSPAASTTLADLVVDESAGRIYLGGHVRFFAGGFTDLYVGAYDLEGAPLVGWGSEGNGTTFYNFFSFEQAVGIDLSPDGGVVLGATIASIVAELGALKLTSNGVIDTSFGSNGLARASFGGTDRATDIAVQPDGKVVLVGHTNRTASNIDKFAVARFTATGQPDNTFDGDGELILENVQGQSRASSVTIDASGRIVIAGSARMNTSSDFAVVRLNSSGAPDTSFSGDGIAYATFGAADFAEDLSILPNGTIVVAGWTEPASSGTRDMSVARFTRTGLLDSNFTGNGLDIRHRGGDEQLLALTSDSDGSLIAAGTAGDDLALLRYRGYTEIGFGSGGRVVGFDSVDPLILNAVARQPDGKIVTAGFLFNTPGGVGGAFRFERYLPDGSRDASFGIGGIRDVDPTLADDDDGATGVAIAPNGDIIGIGHVFENNQDYWTVVALDSNGNVESNFGGGNGIVSFLPGGGTRGTPAAVLVQPDGKILIGGNTVDPVRQDHDLTLVRLNPDGSFDPSFGGGDGIVIFPIANGNNHGIDGATDLALFDDGSIAVSSSTTLFNGKMAVAVLDRAGNPDTTFSFNGQRILDDVPGITRGSAIAIDEQQRILIAGSARGTGSPFNGVAVARLTRTGAFDNTFAGNGNDLMLLDSTFATVRDMAITPDGDITVMGSMNRPGQPSDILLARWNSNGTHDTRFVAVDPFAGTSGSAAGYDVAGRADFGNAMVALPDGDLIVVGRSDFRGIVARITGPTTAVDADFVVDAPTQRLVVQFNADVSASLATSDFDLVNLRLGQTIPSVLFNVAYDAANDRAIVTFPGLANGVLPDGEYRLTINRANVQDTAGNRLADDLVFDFFFLNGDANRDGRVNLEDFNILAANFGQSNRLFSQGDFDYSGNVNLSDFNILASRFGVTLAPPATTSSGLSSGSDRTSRGGADDLLDELA